jgi:hypothetical protein
MDEVMLAEVQAGVVITYRMRLSDRPTNPQRLWHGVVEDVYTGAYMVRLIEPGYEGLKEIVFFHQIVGTDEGLQV